MCSLFEFAVNGKDFWVTHEGKSQNRNSICSLEEKTNKKKRYIEATKPCEWNKRLLQMLQKNKCKNNMKSEAPLNNL